MRMTARIESPYKPAPEAIKAMMALEAAIKASTLEPLLIDLVKMRASQINGCAFCLHLHSTDARKGGEREMRLYLLTAWRESSAYTPRVRAALAWTEALTLISETGAPDEDWNEVKANINEAAQVNLTLLIGAINSWNRFAIGLRMQHPKGDKLAAA